MKKLIEPEDYYSIDQIVQGEFFPWIKSSTAIRNWIQRDMEYDNHIKAKSRGEGKGRRYWIRGRDIISVIAKFEDGTLFLNEKQSGKIPTKKTKSGRTI